MAAYSQQNIKRQKTATRDPSRSVEIGDYFPGITKVEYKTNTHLLDDNLCYRYYNAPERIHGKTMEEWIKPAISFAAFKYNGSDAAKPIYQRNWDDHTNSVENHKRCLKACSEFCTKLGVKYWTAYDHDIYPASDNLDMNVQHSEEIIDFISELQQHNQLKPLWISPNLYTDSKYASGASTTNEANVFVAASQQTKRALEIAHRLNAESFLIWLGDEGYNTILNTDFPRELKQCARFTKMASNYKERISYRGQLLLGGSNHQNCAPNNKINYHSYNNGFKNKYFSSFSDMLCFLKHYNLDRYFKLTCKPGHELSMANMYNMVGCMELSDSNFSLKDATILMKTIIDQGGLLPGGININVIPSRESTDVQDLFLAYINIIDTLAKGLRVAAKVYAEQTFAKTIQQRYISFSSGYGSRISNSEVNFEDCEEQLRKLQGQSNEVTPSAKNEHLQLLLQRYMDSI